MGKTKTAFVEGVTEVKTGKAAYEEKMRKKAAAQKAAKEKKAQVKGVGLKGGERIKLVEVELPPESGTAQFKPAVGEEHPSPQSSQPPKKLPKTKGKKYINARAKIDRKKLYTLPEAIKLVKETTFSKFDSTMELHLVVKKTGINVRATLPHQAGKEKKIEIADDKTVEKLKEGKIDFDLLLATPDMMPKLIPFAKLLGPKGLMPNPKMGTLIKNAKEAEKFSGNTVSLKTEKEQPIIHTVLGKVSQSDKELEENANAILNTLNRKMIIKAYLKSTMSPSLKLET